MRGVNGDGAGTTADGRPMTGALRFEARVRVLPTGGTRRASGDAVVVRGADAVTLLIAAATSYRTYEDVGADPAARVAAALDPAVAQERRRAARRAHPRLPAAVQSRDARSRRRRRARADRRARAWVRRRATIPVSPRSTSSTAATCSSPARGRVRSRPTCRASGTRACRRRGAASTPSTSTPR